MAKSQVTGHLPEGGAGWELSLAWGRHPRTGARSFQSLNDCLVKSSTQSEEQRDPPENQRVSVSLKPSLFQGLLLEFKK